MLMLRVWCCIFVLYHPNMFFFIFVNNQFPNQFSLPGSGGRWSSGNRRASAQSSCQRMASWDRRTMRPSGYRWGWRTAHRGCHRGCLKWCLDLLSLCSNPELAQLVRNLKVSRNRLKTFEDSWADTVDEIWWNCDHKSCQSAFWSKYFEHPQSWRFSTPEASMLPSLGALGCLGLSSCHTPGVWASFARDARSLAQFLTAISSAVTKSDLCGCHRVIIPVTGQSAKILFRNMPETGTYRIFFGKIGKSLFAESSCGGSNLHFF